MLHLKKCPCFYFILLFIYFLEFESRNMTNFKIKLKGSQITVYLFKSMAFLMRFAFPSVKIQYLNMLLYKIWIIFDTHLIRFFFHLNQTVGRCAIRSECQNTRDSKERLRNLAHYFTAKTNTIHVST